MTETLPNAFTLITPVAEISNPSKQSSKVIQSPVHADFLLDVVDIPLLFGFAADRIFHACLRDYQLAKCLSEDEMVKAYQELFKNSETKWKCDADIEKALAFFLTQCFGDGGKDKLSEMEEFETSLRLKDSAEASRLAAHFTLRRRVYTSDGDDAVLDSVRHELNELDLARCCMELSRSTHLAADVKQSYREQCFDLFCDNEHTLCQQTRRGRFSYICAFARVVVDDVIESLDQSKEIDMVMYDSMLEVCIQEVHRYREEIDSHLDIGDEATSTYLLNLLLCRFQLRTALGADAAHAGGCHCAREGGSRKDIVPRALSLFSWLEENTSDKITVQDLFAKYGLSGEAVRPQF